MVSSAVEFMVERINDNLVLQTFSDEVEDILDIYYFQSFIRSKFFTEQERGETILNYIYGYRKVIINVETLKASVVEFLSSEEEINEFLRKNIYSLDKLREQAEVKHPWLSHLQITKL
jgi:hypothetical protein